MEPAPLGEMLMLGLRRKEQDEPEIFFVSGRESTKNDGTWPKRYRRWVEGTLLGQIRQFQLLRISPTLVLFAHFVYNDHPNGCEVVSYCSFDVHFLNDQRCWVSFHVLVSHYISLEKCLLESFIYFWITLFYINPLPDMICKYLLPFCNCLFTLRVLFDARIFSGFYLKLTVMGPMQKERGKGRELTGDTGARCHGQGHSFYWEERG